MQQAMELLRSVDDEELSFDRTVQVSPIDRLEKRHILGRLPFNLATLDALVQRNRRDFRTLQKNSLPKARRKAAWMRLAHRRRRAVRLIEELGLRIEFLEELWPPLKEVARRAEDLRTRIERLKKRNGPRKRSLWKEEAEEVNRILEYVGQSPRGLRNRVRRLRSVYQEYQQAKRQLSEGNLRLVVSIAKNYRHRGVGFLDLIQEGNAGLMRAVEKFEYRRGFKFSTYATWWIRQAVSRAVSDQSRTVRVPAHMFSTMSFIQKVFRRLQHELGRAPTVEEVAKAARTTPDEARAVLSMNRVPMSLDRPVGDTDDTNFGDLLSGSESPDPAVGAVREMLRGEIDEILEGLGYREREIIKLRYGLGDGYNYTLEEVATIFRVTRERIRQIEARAFQKIQQSANVKRLAGFLD
jgi:RNA polymerase primary sigma factor